MENELKINVKELSAEEQFLIRKQIVRLRKQGKTTAEVVEITGAKERTVQSTWKKYSEGGFSAIRLKTRGRKTGEARTLTPEQERQIQDIIIDKTPEQMKLEGCLWTRKNTRELILVLYKIDMPVRTVNEYLRRWGYSVQRPIKRAYKQNPEHIQKWLDEEYPAIKEQCKAENGEIYWGDETGIQNTSNYARGYAPKGQTPVLRVDVTRFKINMIAALTNQGKMRFMLYRENMNQEKLIKFMEKLIKDAGKKVFLILDNLKVHHGKIVTEWLSDKKCKIEVFFLPSYAPEYNPDEYLNNDLKQNLGNRHMARSIKEIENNVTDFMNNISINYAHIMSYFKHQHAVYAA